MSETLRQRLLAAVFDDEVIGDDLVRDLALSCDAHGELVRLATVLAGLPGHGARAAEARLDGLLDQVSLVAASMSAMARGSDVMRASAAPPPARPADPRMPSDPRMSAGQRPATAPGVPAASKRIRVDRKPVLVGVAIAAAIIVGFLAWPGRRVGETTRGAGSRPVAVQPAPPPLLPAPVAPARPAPPPAPAAPVREAAHDPQAVVNLEIRVSPSTATIAIDGAAVDGNPFSDSRARDGAIHRIRVSAPGYIPKTLSVEFSANLVLDVSLEPAHVAVAAAAPPPPLSARPPLTPPVVTADGRAPEPSRALRPAAPEPARPSAREAERPGASEGRVPLMITTNVPGSEIAIDDIVVGTTPLRESLWVRPGTHEITVRHEGYMARTRSIDVDAANASSIQIALTSSSAPAAARDAGEGTKPARRIDPVSPYAGSGSDR